MVADDDIKALLNEANESEGISVELKDDVSSLLTESLKSDENTIEVTAEDVAWADSCFAFGAELSDDKWIALKDALLDALDSYPTNDEAPSAGAESKGEHEVIQAEATEGDHVMEDYPSEDMQKEKVSDAEVSVSQEDTLRNIFKVNGHAAEHHLAEETQKEVSNVDVSVTQGEDRESRESIFRVWDLGTPAVEEEEDELIQQLNKLLTGSKPPQSKDPSLALNDENVDELVTSMNDLSLKHFDK